jgi:hypothetical protein
MFLKTIDFLSISLLYQTVIFYSIIKGKKRVCFITPLLFSVSLPLSFFFFLLPSKERKERREKKQSKAEQHFPYGRRKKTRIPKGVLTLGERTLAFL